LSMVHHHAMGRVYATIVYQWQFPCAEFLNHCHLQDMIYLHFLLTPH
jgi:hypothetical protein